MLALLPRSVRFHPNLRMRALGSESIKRLWVLKESSLLYFAPQNGTMQEPPMNQELGPHMKPNQLSLPFSLSLDLLGFRMRIGFLLIISYTPPDNSSFFQYPEKTQKEHFHIFLHPHLRMVIIMIISNRILADTTPCCGGKGKREYLHADSMLSAQNT